MHPARFVNHLLTGMIIFSMLFTMVAPNALMTDAQEATEEPVVDVTATPTTPPPTTTPTTASPTMTPIPPTLTPTVMRDRKSVV